MNYRELTSRDYIECRALYDRISLTKSNALLGLPVPAVLNLFYFDDNEPLNKIFGGFDDYGVLCTCVFVKFSKYDRSVTISYVMKQHFATLQTVVDTINFVLEYSESRNFCKVYINYFNHNKGWERIISRRSTMLTRYTSVTEEIIPEKKKSSFEKYWFEVQCCRIFDVPIIIKMYSLKEEFRPILKG